MIITIELNQNNKAVLSQNAPKLTQCQLKICVLLKKYNNKCKNVCSRKYCEIK